MQGHYAQAYADLYQRHWWWRSREQLVLRTLRGLKLPEGFTALDVGCGAGLLLPALHDMGGDPRGVEVDLSMLTPDTPMRHRIDTDPIASTRYDARRCDLVTALDVVEHVEDDAGFVARMVQLLKPGGRLLITVPAFMSLWDEHDVMNRHHRRYRADGLRRLLAPHGQLVTLRYAYHAIFPVKLAVRMLNRSRQRKVAQHTLPPAPVNALMTRLCALEHRLNLPLPFGTSLLAVVQKPESSSMTVKHAA